MGNTNSEAFILEMRLSGCLLDLKGQGVRIKKQRK